MACLFLIRFCELDYTLSCLKTSCILIQLYHCFISKSIDFHSTLVDLAPVKLSVQRPDKVKPEEKKT